MRLPIWYRFQGDRRWRIGLTETISEDRVVIRSAGRVATGDAITIVLPLPRAACRFTGCIISQGRVTRAGSRSPRVSSSFAAALTTSRLERGERAFERRAA